MGTPGSTSISLRSAGGSSIRRGNKNAANVCRCPPRRKRRARKGEDGAQFLMASVKLAGSIALLCIAPTTDFSRKRLRQGVNEKDGFNLMTAEEKLAPQGHCYFWRECTSFSESACKIR